jgi:hypothetical protein
MLASNRVRCLAYGIAIVVFGSLSIAHAEPVSLATPAGLAPGAQFRFLFLTSGTQAATSTDIADYNTFVNSQASGATYEGSVVSWKAVGSTATVNARDNVGGFGGNGASTVDRTGAHFPNLCVAPKSVSISKVFLTLPSSYPKARKSTPTEAINVTAIPAMKISTLLIAWLWVKGSACTREGSLNNFP